REALLGEAGDVVALGARPEVAVLGHLVATFARARGALEHAFLRVAVFARCLGVLAGDGEADARLIVVERARLPRQRRVAARAGAEIVVLALFFVAGGAGERRRLEA